MRLPNVISVTGSIAAIKELAGAEYEVLRRDTVAITLQKLDGGLATVWVSKAQVEEYGLEPIMFVGNIVSVDMNENIAGETYYVDQDGDEIDHDQTFNSFVNMISTMPTNLSMLGVKKFIIATLIEQREEHARKFNKVKEPRFHPLRRPVADENKEAQITALLVKRGQTLNPVIKSNIDQRLANLGYDVTEADKAATSGAPIGGGSGAPILGEHGGDAGGAGRGGRPFTPSPTPATKTTTAGLMEESLLTPEAVEGMRAELKKRNLPRVRREEIMMIFRNAGIEE